MFILDELSKRLAPHTGMLVNAMNELETHLGNIHERLSDLGRPDTGDHYHSIIRRATITGNMELGSPKSGEFWLIQGFVVNGLALKSPSFVLRTTLGRLLFAVIAEGMGTETPGGDLIVLPGEEIVFEPTESGKFDFCLHFIRRKLPAPAADATGGISQEGFTSRQQHEPSRDGILQRLAASSNGNSE